MRILRTFALAALLGVSFEAHAQDSTMRKCPVPPADARWTKQERFVWDRVTAGQIANFNSESGYGGSIDPKNPNGLPDSRVLTPEFLETILLDDKYRCALTRQGVRIIGARFDNPINLVNAEINHELWLDRSLLKQGANFVRMKAKHVLSFRGSKFAGILDMNAVQIEKSLFMNDKAMFAEVDLGSAHIGDSLDLSSSTVTGRLEMDKLRVDSSVFMRDKATFAEVDLGSARILGTLSFIGSTVTGKLNMDKLRVDSSLFMREKATFAEVILRSAHIGGTLDLAGSTVTGELNMNSLQVDSSLFMRDKATFAEVNLGSAHIGGTLSFSSATVKGKLDMDKLRVDSSMFMRDKATFAEVILRSAHIKGTLDLTGSTVTGELSMDNLQVDGSVFMGEKAKFAGVDLLGAHIKGTLDLSSSTVSQRLDMDRLQVDSSVFMRDQATFAQIVLDSAHIGGMLTLANSTVKGQLDMENLRVDRSLRMDNAQFADVKLNNARIGGSLYLTGSTIAKDVNMVGLKVDESLMMDNKSQFAGVQLEGARIGSKFSLNGSKVKGLLNGNTLVVEKYTILTDAEFLAKVDFTSATFKENVYLNSSIFHGVVDFTSARIGSELQLGSTEASMIQWKKTEEPALILENTKVETMPALSDAWPPLVVVNGLTYRSLRGPGAANDRWRTQPTESTVAGWLNKQIGYAPQPYEQLASVFQAQGHAEIATTIRHASRVRERDESGLMRYASMTVLDWVIGYGHRMERALYWVIGLVFLGAVVLRVSGQGIRNGMPIGISYSFDMLLPVIRLRDAHYDVDLIGWPRYYFYCHKIMGYILASFLIVGISGLTK